MLMIYPGDNTRTNRNVMALDLWRTKQSTTEIATRRKMCVVAIYTHRDMLWDMIKSLSIWSKDASNMMRISIIMYMAQNEIPIKTACMSLASNNNSTKSKMPLPQNNIRKYAASFMNDKISRPNPYAIKKQNVTHLGCSFSRKTPWINK